MARVIRISPGVYRVDRDAAEGTVQEIVYVAGAIGRAWAFSNGRVYRSVEPATAPRSRAASAVQSLTSPMPATVVTVAAAPGQAVKAGDTLVIVEAMKMELPIRAPSDAVIRAVHCREGDIVQPDQTLIELD